MKLTTVRAQIDRFFASGASIAELEALADHANNYAAAMDNDGYDFSIPDPAEAVILRRLLLEDRLPSKAA